MPVKCMEIAKIERRSDNAPKGSEPSMAAVDSRKNTIPLICKTDKKTR